MPELPEVETIARGLRPDVVGRMVVAVRCYWARHIFTPELAELQMRLPGKRVTAVGRRGKYLVFDLDGPDTLIMHLKMSGQLAVTDPDEPLHAHVRTVFELDDSRELRFTDQRKFGKVYLVSDPDQVLGKLGPEPLTDAFSVDGFTQQLRKRKRAMKPLLLDQSFVAGVGNIYADEALHQAGIHPLRPADTLTAKEIQKLHAAIRSVLVTGIEKQGATISLYRQPSGQSGSMQDEFTVYGRTGEPCLRCGQPIERAVVAARGTHYCPMCQV